MAHNIPSMMALAPKTEETFKALPAEFTKREFNEVRDRYADDRYPRSASISLETAREYGLVYVVRTEKTTYRKEARVFINPKTKDKYTEEQLDELWCKKLAREFGLPFNGGYLPGFSDLRKFVDYAEMEFEGFRNVFGVNWNKFHDLMDGKRKF